MYNLLVVLDKFGREFAKQMVDANRNANYIQKSFVKATIDGRYSLSVVCNYIIEYVTMEWLNQIRFKYQMPYLKVSR